MSANVTVAFADYVTRVRLQSGFGTWKFTLHDLFDCVGTVKTVLVVCGVLFTVIAFYGEISLEGCKGWVVRLSPLCAVGIEQALCSNIVVSIPRKMLNL